MNIINIKIITDNCCDLPNELLEQYDITVVPLRVRFGDEEIPPENFNNASFYARFKNAAQLPSTSQPMPGDFLLKYKQSLADYQEIISIHLSSVLSGTIQSATIAAGMLPGEPIYVFDSKKASVGQGLMVLEAARMAQSGETADAIINRLNNMREKMRCFFVVGNLDTLIKGGRLSRTKALVAGALDIKPVLHLDTEGAIGSLCKARGHRGARNKLIDLMEKSGYDINNRTIGVCHSACPEDAEYLITIIKEQFSVKEIISGEIGPVIGAHVGPGTFGVFFEE